MSSTNKPSRISCDAFSDESLPNRINNGIYNDFNNNLAYPLLNVKGVQLLRSNFVNSSLQLNDYNGQLLFVYCRAEDADNVSVQDFHVVRLHPSYFVPDVGFTDFVKNKYFNDGTELVASLNLAASANGDSTTYNPSWLAGDITFSFDQATRKISFVGNEASSYYSPVPPDHPDLEGFLSGLNQVRMNSINNVTNNYAGAMIQPRISGITMNQRIGFSLKYNNRPIFSTTETIKGCATSSGIPQITGSSTEADSWPILLGAQNINIYCDIICNGQDSRRRRHLLATIPIENDALGVCSYTASALDDYITQTSSEINALRFTFLDDNGNPFYFMANFNTNLELAVYYK